MEIKEGMYVRTNDGYIGKLLEIRECPSGAVHANTGQPVIEYIFDSPMWDSRCTDGYYNDRILNDVEIGEITEEPSCKIIKLLRPDDIVTLISEYCKGDVYRVIEAYDDNVLVDCFEDGYMTIYNRDIESVVTKEQFKRGAYEVNHENQM